MAYRLSWSNGNIYIFHLNRRLSLFIFIWNVAEMLNNISTSEIINDLREFGCLSKILPLIWWLFGVWVLQQMQWKNTRHQVINQCVRFHRDCVAIWMYIYCFMMATVLKHGSFTLLSQLKPNFVCNLEK